MALDTILPLVQVLGHNALQATVVHRILQLHLFNVSQELTRPLVQQLARPVPLAPTLLQEPRAAQQPQLAPGQVQVPALIFQLS